MSNIPGSSQPIQAESLQSTGPVSEAALQAMGAGINYCLANGSAVGDVVSSLLTPTVFQSQRGTNWVLMDGRDVTGSQYNLLTGFTTIPDARGAVLRGKNNGRADGNQNPDYSDTYGDNVDLGAFQTDTFENHTHTVESSNGSPATYDGHAYRGAGNNGDQYGTSAISLTNSASGGNETRMKNITLNHYMRIN
jgi:hypothetical protein